MTAKRFGIVLIVLMACCVTAGASETTKPAEARCLLRISSDSTGISTNTAAIKSLVWSSGVVGKAAKEVLPSDSPYTFSNTSVGIITTSNRPPVSYSLIELSVKLEGRDTQTAERYLNAVIKNLTTELDKTYRAQLEHLNLQLEQARGQRERIIEAIDKASGRTAEDKAIEKQLETRVDLSKLNSDTNLEDALEMLRKSVDPPLKLMVLWNDLLNNAFIVKDTNVGCSGKDLHDVPLRAGIDIVLASASGGFAELSYCVKDGIVTIATKDGLIASGFGIFLQDGMPRHTKFPVELIINQRQSLLKEKYAKQIELSRINARWRAIEEQLPKLKVNVRLQINDDPVSKNIESIISGLQERLTGMKTSADAGMTNLGTTIEMQEKISRARMEQAKRREELGELGDNGMINEFTRELIELAIKYEESQAMFSAIDEQLRQLNNQVAQAEAINIKVAQNHQKMYGLEHIENRIRQLEQEISLLTQPNITVIGGVN